MTVFALVLLTAAIGCGGGSDGPDVVEVTGSVTRDGNPVRNLGLHFHPVQGRPSWARTDGDGKYELQYTRQQDGAVLGKHSVHCSFMPTSMAEETRGPNDEMKEILKKYGNRDDPQLEFEINADTDVIDIVLE